MQSRFWSTYRDGLLIFIRATAGARRNAFAGLYCDPDGKMSLKIAIQAQPEKGKANKAIIQFLAKRLGVAKSQLQLHSGQTDRMKTLYTTCHDQQFLTSLERLYEEVK